MGNHFEYWNSFVLNWVLNPIGPDNLYNTEQDPKTGIIDLSKDYVPEPWWGNCGNNDTPLYSVCLNLNPGKGDPGLQTRSNRSLVAIKQYPDVFQLLPATDNWHATKRAQPIGDALRAEKNIPAGPLKNHLSVELIPWHTEHATGSLGYWSYVKNNIEDVYNHSFMFAAEEAERIEGPLKKTVIMRFSESAANRIFKLFNQRLLVSPPSSTQMSGLSNPNVHATVFKFHNEPNLSGHRFVAIWRSKGFGLNNFPDQESMKDIIRQL